ncbi:ankyrin repeat-containing domain protein [Sporodiniella umbellata]|nr:ankyrin repeat-containing domain protein [Sporodiniella umbellata]
MAQLADSCFVDVDLTEATTIEMEKKPSISIWKAAKTGDMSVLEHYLRTDPSQIDARDPITECTLLHLLLSNVSQPLQPLGLLLQYGADPNIRNIYNIQAIHVAFLHLRDPLEVVSLLLAHHADPNARDGDGWSPLHYASRFCRDPEPVLKLLVGAGANVHATDVSRKSALFSLLAGGDHSVALDWLIRHGANVLVKDMINLSSKY